MADELMTGYVMGQNDNNNGGGLWGGEGIWGIIILAMVFGWGGFGNGFGGWGGNGGGQGGADTRAAINEGFALNGLENGVRGVQQGLCDGFYAVNTSLLQGFNGVQQGFNTANTAMLQGFNGIQSQLCNMAAQNQACCCETQRIMERGFADANYNLATQECQTRQAIVDAGRAAVEASNANTRAIMDFMVQDKLQTLRDENQALKFAASQATQNTYLSGVVNAEANRMIARIAPYPIPAYQVANPMAGVGCGGNNGCCNNGCW